MLCNLLLLLYSHSLNLIFYRLILLLDFFPGAFTNAQSTLTSWSNINFPSMFSIALFASSFSLYSIKQYPFTNPVLRSKFKCKFEISPKSPKFSCTSSSCASSWTPVTRTTQPSMDFWGWPLSPSLSPKVSYRSFRECLTSSSIISAFSKPRPCAKNKRQETGAYAQSQRKEEETQSEEQSFDKTDDFSTSSSHQQKRKTQRWWLIITKRTFCRRPPSICLSSAGALSSSSSLLFSIKVFREPSLYIE